MTAHILQDMLPYLGISHAFLSQQVDRATVQQARSLLESLMLRRLKSAVESSLAPKLEFVLKVTCCIGGDNGDSNPVLGSVLLYLQAIFFLRKASSSVKPRAWEMQILWNPDNT